MIGRIKLSNRWIDVCPAWVITWQLISSTFVSSLLSHRKLSISSGEYFFLSTLYFYFFLEDKAMFRCGGGRSCWFLISSFFFLKKGKSEKNFKYFWSVFELIRLVSDFSRLFEIRIDSVKMQV